MSTEQNSGVQYTIANFKCCEFTGDYTLHRDLAPVVEIRVVKCKSGIFFGSMKKFLDSPKIKEMQLLGTCITISASGAN